MLLSSGDSRLYLVVRYSVSSIIGPQFIFCTIVFYTCFFCIYRVPRNSAFSGLVFFEPPQQEEHIGQSMSYFHHLQVRRNKGLRSLLRSRVIQMGS